MSPADLYCTLEVDSFGYFVSKAKTRVFRDTTEPKWDEVSGGAGIPAWTSELVPDRAHPIPSGPIALTPCHGLPVHLVPDLMFMSRTGFRLWPHTPSVTRKPLELWKAGGCSLPHAVVLTGPPHPLSPLQRWGPHLPGSRLASEVQDPVPSPPGVRD